MGNTYYFAWESTLMQWIQANMGGVGEFLAAVFTACGEQLVIVAILGFLYWSYDKKFGLFVGTNIIVSLVWNPMIKNVILRRRPYFDIPEIKCLRPVSTEADIYDIPAQGFSFPSGHSTNSVAVYTSLPVYRKRKWLIAVGVILPFLVGLSRVCLGVHYPTDVIAGWLLGALTVLFISYWQRHTRRKWLMYAILALIGLPGCFYCKSTDYFSSYGLMLGFFAGNLFEEHFVCFENDRRPLVMLLRFVGGITVFLGLNALLKLPFSSDFLASTEPLSRAFRVVRYALILFIDMGLYPMLFRFGKPKREDLSGDSKTA